MRVLFLVVVLVLVIGGCSTPDAVSCHLVCSPDEEQDADKGVNL